MPQHDDLAAAPADQPSGLIRPPASSRLGTYWDPTRHDVVTPDGRRIRLDRQKGELLCLLLERQGRIVSKGFLKDTLWYDLADDKVLKVHICHLRRLLGDTGLRITTIYNVGFRADIVDGESDHRFIQRCFEHRDILTVALRSQDWRDRHDAKRLHLTPTEQVILDFLFSHPDEIVSKFDLFDDLYSHLSGDPDAKVIDVFVSKLRQKLAATDIEIQTIWGVGLRLRTDRITEEDDHRFIRRCVENQETVTAALRAHALAEQRRYEREELYGQSLAMQ